MFIHPAICVNLKASHSPLALMPPQCCHTRWWLCRGCWASERPAQHWGSRGGLRQPRCKRPCAALLSEPGESRVSPGLQTAWLSHLHNKEKNMSDSDRPTSQTTLRNRNYWRLGQRKHVYHGTTARNNIQYMENLNLQNLCSLLTWENVIVHN